MESRGKATLEFATWVYEQFGLASVLGDGVLVAVVNDRKEDKDDGKE